MTSHPVPPTHSPANAPSNTLHPQPRLGPSQETRAAAGVPGSASQAAERAGVSPHLGLWPQPGLLVCVCVGGGGPVLNCRALEVSSQRQSQAARGGRQLGYRAASVTGPVTVSGLSALLRHSLGVGRIPQRFSCPSPGLRRSPPHSRAQENPTGD